MQDKLFLPGIVELGEVLDSGLLAFCCLCGSSSVTGCSRSSRRQRPSGTTGPRMVAGSCWTCLPLPLSARSPLRGRPIRVVRDSLGFPTCRRRRPTYAVTADDTAFALVELKEASSRRSGLGCVRPYRDDPSSSRWTASG